MPNGRAKEFRRVAARLGFERQRQTGSHERSTHVDGRAVRSLVRLQVSKQALRTCDLGKWLRFDDSL